MRYRFQAGLIDQFAGYTANAVSFILDPYQRFLQVKNVMVEIFVDQLLVLLVQLVLFKPKVFMVNVKHIVHQDGFVQNKHYPNGHHAVEKVMLV